MFLDDLSIALSLYHSLSLSHSLSRGQWTKFWQRETIVTADRKQSNTGNRTSLQKKDEDNGIKFETEKIRIGKDFSGEGGRERNKSSNNDELRKHYLIVANYLWICISHIFKCSIEMKYFWFRLLIQNYSIRFDPKLAI